VKYEKRARKTVENMSRQALPFGPSSSKIYYGSGFIAHSYSMVPPLLALVLIYHILNDHQLLVFFSCRPTKHSESMDCQTDYNMIGKFAEQARAASTPFGAENRQLYDSELAVSEIKPAAPAKEKIVARPSISQPDFAPTQLLRYASRLATCTGLVMSQAI